MRNSWFMAQRQLQIRLRGSRSFVATLAGAVTLITMAACGGDSSISPRTVATIIVSPASASVAPGGTQQFTAVGKDASGNVVSFTPTWSVVAGGGSIDSHGLFTAGSTSGDFTNTVKATSGSISATSTVTVGATQQNVAGAYTLKTIDGKAPPDTVETSPKIVEFLDGTLTLNADATYKLLFHTRITNGGTVSADSSGSTGTFTASGDTLIITPPPSGTPPVSHSVLATIDLPTISFTDGGKLFVFSK